MMRVVIAMAGMLAASSIAHAAAPSAPAAPVATEAAKTHGDAPVKPAVARRAWAHMPSGDDIARYYPESALRAGVDGETTVVCDAAVDGTLHACELTAESPVGYGFGAAAVRAAALFSVRPTTVDGRPVEGGKVRIPLHWLTQRTMDAAVQAAGPRAVPIPAPAPDYPETARAAGHQGEVWLTRTVRADGSMTAPTIKQSSRSVELDQAALAAFSARTFAPGGDAQGRPVDTVVSTKLEFYKDTLSSVGQKSCADFVTDVRWYSSTFPEKKRSEMHIYGLTLGVFTILAANGDHVNGMLMMIRRFPAAFDQAFDRCVEKPNAKFIEVLKSTLS